MDFKNLTLKELLSMIEADDKAGLTRLLSDFTGKWNDLIEENKQLKEKIKLKGIDLKEKDLSGADFSGIEIEDADFSGSDLSKADFSDTIITKTRFDNADMSYSAINHARISQTSLVRAKMYNISLHGTYFTGSVNTFQAYWHEKSDEDTYRTHPDITRRGFRKAEAYEHAEEDEKDYY